MPRGLLGSLVVATSLMLVKGSQIHQSRQVLFRVVRVSINGQPVVRKSSSIGKAGICTDGDFAERKSSDCIAIGHKTNELPACHCKTIVAGIPNIGRIPWRGELKLCMRMNAAQDPSVIHK